MQDSIALFHEHRPWQATGVPAKPSARLMTRCAPYGLSYRRMAVVPPSTTGPWLVAGGLGEAASASLTGRPASLLSGVLQTGPGKLASARAGVSRLFRMSGRHVHANLLSLRVEEYPADRRAVSRWLTHRRNRNARCFRRSAVWATHASPLSEYWPDSCVNAR